MRRNGQSIAGTRGNQNGRWRLAVELLVLNLLLLAAFPAILLWLLRRTLLRGKPLGRWRHRIGLVPAACLGSALPKQVNASPRIWLHAVSAGEVVAVKPVLDEIHGFLPQARMVLSTVTAAGMVMAQRSCAAHACFYFPFDSVISMGLALSRIRPQLVVITEKELWPNFLGLARLFGSRVLLVNGRVSERMMQRARWAPGFVRWLYRLPDLLCVQSEQDARRLQELGVPATRIAVTGNTKVDSLPASGGPSPAGNRPAEAGLASEIGVDSAEDWLVAGSTHPGEEEAVIDAFHLIRARLPQARLLLAPRHLERVPSVSAAVAQRGLPVVRRSEARLGGQANGEAVIILDTMGELWSAYGFAAAGFVGGTLAPVGGHNLLEPLAAGRPVLFGPHTENCGDVADLLREFQVGFLVANADELASQFVKIATDENLRARLRQAAATLLAQQRGAARRCAEIARDLLTQAGRIASPGRQ